ncbi:alanine/glycine:cation symporter family protein [Pseudosulfitobacter pseudonitzschiae]|uniref:alanine/glycine:cation symporter family protein n=1 Tax=Pseudosulfitobacter pseudonitzschiae TaxID=1402135 RepID=UPI001AF9DA90|nr:alanine/glycine:cation symporter family protein [Pseudosulfitobacter pseudonitzschiae]MBM1815873.1 alanine:cation symporter family protein [Pseudosulfitobacter pseudonitzschiae]MBM1832864.1 alanine:cation symporter family protein [Pseudosulfitobacter pseudonitzschiae]MBM1837732.1 alanine:cation symporter family protein [Pseudosulfitobacter pseudonitzschiae]MBM1842578.1 alanine:cation symporter family protein [Pseudosulfitobacter pseudonitzschiae]MBM1847446.1 alanine:cation symporter family 
MNIMQKTALTLAAFSATAAPALAQEAGSLDARVNEAFAAFTGPFVNLIFAPFPGTSFPWIVMWLVVAATVFTLYFGFVQFRFFSHAIALVKGDYSDPNDAGEVSHFQALATALSGTVGLGNIAGVAVAVGIGGPGATFWMILAGLLGMASKFTECTLGVKYRNEYPDGTVSGGPMYYISKGFSELGLPGGKFLAVLFSIFCILGAFGGGNMFQANQAHAQIAGIVGDYPGWITGIIFAAIVFAVIVGGIKSIANVTEKIVPFMGILYVGAALVILVVNYDKIGWAFGQIFEGAFSGLGVAGGLVGALIQGFKRAAFSNEAGVGSAAIAHSAVRTKEPITEGFVSLLEPLIDTVVICTMTALVITISQQLIVDPDTGRFVLNEAGTAIATVDGNTGVALTSAAFASGISWFPYVLAVAVILFAFSTMISWSYYGLKAWTYLFGEGKTSELTFKLIFCVFIVIGAAASLGPVIDFSDAAIFAMAVVNIFALYFLMRIVRKELNSYASRLKSGAIAKFN